MKNQVLSISQCEELVTLGLDMSDAKFYFNKNFPNELYILHKGDYIEKQNNKYIFHFKVGDDREEWIQDNLICTYTFQDIMNILIKNGKGYKLEHTDEVKITIYSQNLRDIYTKIIAIKYGKTDLIAAFKMLKWCIENKYIKV